jgi:hypothetical protein
MAASLCLSGNQNPFNFGGGTTRYVSVGIARLAGPNIGEAGLQRTERTAGVRSGLYINVVTNTTTSASTITFWVNGANGNQTITIPAGTTGVFTDDVNTDSIADGDEIAYQVVTGGGGIIGVVALSTIFTPTNANETVSPWVGGAGLESPAASTTYFLPLIGFAALETTEANRQFKSPIAGTLRNLYSYTGDNGRSTDTIYTVRINGVDTGITVTVAGGATGVFEDTTHEVSVAVGDLISLSAVTGTGTGDIGGLYALEFVTSTGQSVLLTGWDTVSELTSATTPRYLSLAGTIQGATTTEARAANELRASFTVSHLRAYVSANSLDAGAATITVRKNAGDTAIAASHASGSGAGWIEDVTDDEDFVAADEGNYAFTVTGASSGGVTFQVIGVVLTAPAAAGRIFKLAGAGGGLTGPARGLVA